MRTQESIVSGRSPRASRRRRAPPVRPSPQHLSRGKRALSSTTTRAPARARVMAAAQPAGPAPATTTSTASADDGLKRTSPLAVLEGRPDAGVQLRVGEGEARALQAGGD